MRWKIGNNCFNFILFLSGQKYGIYFSFLTYIFSRYLRNIHEKKFWTHENTHKKKLGPTKYPQKKSFRPTKYPWEKPLDPRNTHEKNYGPTKARWHDGTKPTRPTMAREPQNLARSIKHKMRNIFLEKAYTKCGGETLPRPFKKSKLSIFLNQ